jgi:circadian clock protein KaiB
MASPEEFKKTTPELFEQEISQSQEEYYVLRLYISGTTTRSVKALKNIKKICEENLQGRYELEVIDVYQKPEIILAEHILAIPTLIKKLPEPLRKIIGTLSNKEKILLGLDIIPKKILGGNNNE